MKQGKQGDVKESPMRIYRSRDHFRDEEMRIWMVVKIVVPFEGTMNIRCRNILGIQKGTLVLTTTHRVCLGFGVFRSLGL